MLEQSKQQGLIKSNYEQIIMTVVINMAERYHTNLDHASQVAKFATHLFRQLKKNCIGCQRGMSYYYKSRVIQVILETLLALVTIMIIQPIFWKLIRLLVYQMKKIRL